MEVVATVSVRTMPCKTFFRSLLQWPPQGKHIPSISRGWKILKRWTHLHNQIFRVKRRLPDRNDRGSKRFTNNRRRSKLQPFFQWRGLREISTRNSVKPTGRTSLPAQFVALDKQLPHKDELNTSTILKPILWHVRWCFKALTRNIPHIGRETGSPITLPFWTLVNKRSEIERRKMLKFGFIETEAMSWSLPVVFSTKKHYTYHSIFYYGHLNSITVLDSNPLPRMD